MGNVLYRRVNNASMLTGEIKAINVSKSFQRAMDNHRFLLTVKCGPIAILVRPRRIAHYRALAREIVSAVPLVIMAVGVLILTAGFINAI